MDKVFPYKDEEINCWVYDKIPDKMEAASSPKQLPFGTLILYKATLSSLEGYYIATKVNKTNRESVILKLARKEIFIIKRGVS